jgi:HEAT repeat protein
MFDFFRRSGPTPKQIERAVRKLTEPHGEAAPRIEAAEKLAAWGTPDATLGLLKRFTISSRVISQDIEEKQFVVGLLRDQGETAVAPILTYMKMHHQVDWAVEALASIVSPDELVRYLQEIIEAVAESEFAAPDHRVSLVRAVHGHVREAITPTLGRFLSDTDDDVRIAAIEALVELGDTVRERLLDAYLEADDRPRIRRRIAEIFAEKGWDVKGYRPSMEDSLPEGFQLNAKGVVRRR